MTNIFDDFDLDMQKVTTESSYASNATASCFSMFFNCLTPWCGTQHNCVPTNNESSCGQTICTMGNGALN